MAGKSIKLGSSPCTITRQQEKRKQSATRGEQAKKQRPAQPNGAAVPVTPLQAAGINAVAMAFPMVGVNGVAPRWSTAAALGAASRAAALPLPVMAGANGPAAPMVFAPTLGLQAPGAVSNVATPLVLARVAGQLMPVPIQFFGYESTAGVIGVPAPAGMPLAAALARFPSCTLGRMLSALMPVCYPPLRQHESRTGAQPAWWPTASEHWWAPEVVAHLHRMPTNTPVPFVAGYLLNKAQKAAVLVAIVKHLAPNFARITDAVRHCRLSGEEDALWTSALQNEHAKCMMPVFILQELPPPQQQVDDHQRPPSCNTSESVVHGGAVAPYGNVTAPTNDVHEVAVAAAEPEPQPEQDGDAHATDLAAAELGEQQLEDTLVPLQMQQGDEVHQLADRSPNGVEPPGAAAAPVEAVEDGDWSEYDSEELSRMLSDLGTPTSMGTPCSFDDVWDFN